VAKLTLDFVTALANEPASPRSFRGQSRSESDATKKALESQAHGEPSVATTPQPSTGSGQTADGQAQLSAPQRPRWGIGTRSDPGEPTNPVVVRITAGSPAAQAGLTLGDRVAAINGTDILSQADMVARLAAAGNGVVVDVERKGRMLRLEMTQGDINTSAR